MENNVKSLLPDFRPNGSRPAARHSWRDLFRSCHPHQCAKGQPLFLQGSLAADFFLLDSGLMKLTCTLSSGAEALLALRFPGELAEICAPILTMPHAFSASALTACTLRRMETSRLLSIIKAGGAEADSVVRNLVTELYATVLAVIELKTLTARQRLEKVRLELNAVGKTPFMASIRDAGFAALLGISAQHFSRIKGKFPESSGASRHLGRSTQAA